MKKWVLILPILLMAVGCHKERRRPADTLNRNPLNVNVSNEFNWSTGKRSVINLTLTRPASCNQKIIVHVLDSEQQKIMSLTATNFVRIDLMVPDLLEEATIFLPQTQQSKSVTLTPGEQNVTLTLDCPQPKADLDGDGVADEFDEFDNDKTKAFKLTYPYKGYIINGFEDLWPSTGDYDFNDLVLKHRVTYALNPNNERVYGDFELILSAVGAGLHNGLGMQLLYPGLPPQKYYRPEQQLIRSFTGQADAIEGPNILKIYDDVFTAQSRYYTNVGIGPSQVPDTLRFSIEMAALGGQPMFLLPDFFLFRTDNRAIEVHLPDRPATNLADPAQFGTFADHTLPMAHSWYKTIANLSWGIEVMTGSEDFQHPLSKVSIIEAYPGFVNWVNSGGAENKNWYLTPAEGKTFSFSEPQ